MSLPARFSLANLGVRDVARSTEFYQALGWPLSKASVRGEISFFNTDGGILVVWSYNRLADAAGLTPPPDGETPSFRGLACAINLDSQEDVDALLGLALKAGARITQPAITRDWGYSGYFTDPDGHLWEVAYNPHLPIGPHGGIVLP